MSSEPVLSLAGLSGAKVTVMGLGLHGGGAASARFLAERGAQVTVTDLRDADILEPSIRRLADLPIRYVLGRHEDADFRDADLVVKNPAVPQSAPHLKLARRIETDISLFLRFASPRLIAVTGSKGKSTTASAIHHVLATVVPNAHLGGNITTSPLAFFSHASAPGTPVVLELSSWQLADLAAMGVLDPEVSVVLNLLHDHQNRYSGMEAYAADKRVICEGQRATHTAILNYDDRRVRRFADATPAAVLYFAAAPLPGDLAGGWIESNRGIDNLDGAILPLTEESPELPGTHSLTNMLAAGLALKSFGIERSIIRDGLATFRGIRHRLERVAVKRGVTYINDSAATIPDATVAAVTSFPGPVHLIAGGTDKELDFSVITTLPAASVHLLAGSGTEKMIGRLEEIGVTYRGPFAGLEEVVADTVAIAEPGSIVLFSPGCTSFELFLNEFDRGDRFVDLVKKLPD